MVNVSQYLRAAAESRPDGPALVETRAKRRVLSWAEFDRAADSVARSLSAHGLVAGQRVALVMSNRIDLAVAYFGVLRGGLVAVPINPRSSAREIERMLVDSASRMVLCDGVGVDDVRAAASSAKVAMTIAVVDGRPKTGELSFEDFLARGDGADPIAPVDPEALAVLIYTSGTSGQPRGAMLPHRALIANIEQVARLDPPPMTSDDVCLALLPLFHIYGLNAVLGQAVRQSSTTVLVDGFDPEAVLDLIVDEEITNVPIAPPVIAAWAGRPDLKTKLKKVRTLTSGASPLDADLAAEFERSAGVSVDQGYGLTETAPVVATTLGYERAAGSLPKSGSVGRALPGIEIRIVEPSGDESGRGDPAEIAVRGANVFAGYWPDGIDGPDDGGWYRTGDIGFLDEDEELILVDRLKELIIVSGFNVYPREVEEVIAEVDGVAQVAVVGVPDAETGEAVQAFVVSEATAPEQSRLVERIHEVCERDLARFKWPKQVVVVQGLPYSVTGKVAKGRLRSLARAQMLGLD